MRPGDRDLVDDPEAWYATTSDLYAGAHHVVDTVADEVGEETFREVVRMMLQDESAWGDVGDDPGAGSTDGAGWREFLDLAERVGGSTAAREVVLTHVRPGAEDLLARRDRAAEAVDTLADHPWGLPTSVAAAMDAWRFDVAVDRVDQALTARIAAEAVAGRAEERGWAMPDLAASWRTGDLDVLTARVAALDAVIDDVAALEAQAQEAGLPRPEFVVDLDVDEVETTTRRVTGLRRSIDDVVGAQRSLEAVRDDPVATVGLAGTDPDQLRDRARSAFADGDVPGVRRAVDDLDRVVDGASERGRLRLGTGVVALVALLAVVVGVVVLVRRRRAAST